MSCCSCCAVVMATGSLQGKSTLEKIEEELDKIGARKDVHIAFVLRWETSTDIDSWMVEPDGTAIGFNSNYKGKISGENSYNYVLDRPQTGVDYTDVKLTKNTGNLDKDCISCSPVSIENLVYFDRTKMQDGKYQYKLDDYSGAHTKGFKVFIVLRDRKLHPDGFAELEFEGTFSHHPKQQKSSAPTYIEMTKAGENFSFKLKANTLKIKSTSNITWEE